MKTLQALRPAALALAVLLCAAGVHAEKPEWAGGGQKQGGNKQGGDRQGGHQQGGDRHGAEPRGESRAEQRAEQRAESRGDDRHKARQARQRGDVRVGAHFGDRQRTVVRTYYSEPQRAGKCPPGLAKKRNGCMPPGQARKWRMGQPLPRDVVWYPVPSSVVVQLGTPPAGYRYVRVAADILMIAVGSAMVIDAIQDLGRL